MDNHITFILKFSKNFTVTQNYIILYTGRKVYILNKQFNLLKEIEKLQYVYYGYVSSDESFLLLVSNTNVFYTVSLADYAVIRHRIPKPYNGNLEGRGCCLADNSGFILPIQNETTMNSTIRKFHFSNSLNHQDFLQNKYWIIDIEFVKSEGKYLAIGLDRATRKWNLIWMDQNLDSIIYPIAQFDDAILSQTIDAPGQKVHLFGGKQNFICDFYGKVVSKRELVSYDSNINCICKLKKNEDIVLIGTSKGMTIKNAVDNRIYKEIKVEFGVQNICDLQNGYVIYSTWSGIKILELPPINL